MTEGMPPAGFYIGIEVLVVVEGRSGLELT